MPAQEIQPYLEANYYPTIPREEIAHTCRFKLNKSDLTDLGGSFAVVAAEMAKLALDPSSNEGLFRCVFPDGVTGALAQAKDGSGYLGTIMNNGIVGQARWIPVEGAATTIPIDPVTIAIAVALIGINKKLDDIHEVEQEILNFLEEDKESQLKGSVNTLSEIMSDFRFNSSNSIWKGSKTTIAAGIKNKANSSIEFYRKRINDAMDKQDFVHNHQQAKKVAGQVQKNFKCYQLSIYLYAYASFVEVILNGNYKSDYLRQIKDRVEDNSNQYKMDYTKCYDILKDYMKSSIETMALKGFGNVSKNAGSAIAKIPIISKGPVDEALIAAGDYAKKMSKKQTEKTMNSFIENKDAGTRVFIDNIDKIDVISNKAVELLFDRDAVYVCA